jgi:mannosyltransferase
VTRPVDALRPPSWAPAIALVAVTLLGFAVRLFRAGTQSLWVDEIETAKIATRPLGDLVRGVGVDVMPSAWLSPFYYAVLKGVVLLPRPSSEHLLRLSSVVLGTATIPALGWTASRLVSPGVGLVAALLLAVSPFHVWYSQEVRPYVLVVLLATLAIGACLRALETGQRRWWTAFVALAVMGLYTHPIALVVPLVCGLTGLERAVHSGTVARKGLGALAAVAILFLPGVWLIRSLGMNIPADVRAVSVLDLPYAVYAFSVGFSLGPSTADLHGALGAALRANAAPIALSALVFGALLVTGIAGTRRLALERRTCLLSWLVVPLALAIVTAIASPNPFNVRYGIVAYPAYVILLSAGVWSLLSPRRSDRGRLVVGASLLAALLGLSAWSLGSLYFDPHYAKEACRELGALLAAETTEQDLVLVNAPYMESAVRYYYAGPAVVIGYPRAGTPDLSTLVANRARVWLVLSRTFHGDREGRLRSLLGERMVEERQERFPGIVAYRFVPRGAASGSDDDGAR